MIDSVKKTVLSIISKDNRGYITPEEFNLFAKSAQQEIFESYFYNYGKAISKQNNRFLHPTYGTEMGEGFANVPEKLAEVISRFVVSGVLAYNGAALKFYMPGENPALLTEPKAYKLDRLIYNDTVEIDRVDKHKILNLVNSSLTAPSVLYPVYTSDNQGIKVYPTTIASNVMVDYIRYPKDPKWTYTSLSAGEALFNQSATDYQDFELPANDEVNLIVKILQYAGVSIREAELVQMAKAEEVQNNTDK